MLNSYITQCLLWIVVFASGCATTDPPKQPRIPETNSQTPEYETDEQLRRKIGLLEQQLTINPHDTDILLQLSSLYQDLEDYDQALKYMEQLKALDFKGEPRLYGSLGMIYKKREDFAQAVENYRIFKSLVPANALTQTKIEKEINELEFIIETLNNPYEINLRPFDVNINSDSHEYLPQFTLDASTIIFTRRFFNQEDLFVATFTDSGYEVLPLDEINTLENEGAHTITADGSTLILTQCHNKKGYGNCDLYQSKKLSSGEWSRPANLGLRINTRQWDSQPSLSADGRTLYFASKREGGFGGSDIYYSTKRRDGKWSVPKNLGDKINSPGDEESPFIHADGKTLYFRSRRYKSLGGFDIYKSTFVNDNWSEVTNLGSPINTTGQDGALVVSLDGTTGYYATDIYNDTAIGNLDLFQFDLPESLRPLPMTFVKGRVTDANSKIPIEAEIRIASVDNSEFRSLYRTNYNGEFLAAIPVGQPILINIASEDYIFHSDHYHYKQVKYSVDPYLLKVALTRTSDELVSDDDPTPTVLNNIFFASGSAELLSSSESEILILYGLLSDNPNINIEIIGHTDNVGSAEDNLRLSDSRASAVRDALIEKGILESRISFSGKGESQPIDTNDTENGRANNRRTEFIIIK